MWLQVKQILSIWRRAKDFVVITFVDFKKRYNSIYRETLFKVLLSNKFGLDNKRMIFISKTLTNTDSKVKFRGEIFRLKQESYKAMGSGRYFSILSFKK